MPAGSACPMKEHICNRHVLKAIRYWWSDNTLSSQSSLWFDMGLGPARREKLYNPIRRHFVANSLECRVPVSIRPLLRKTTKIHEVQALVFKNLVRI